MAYKKGAGAEAARIEVFYPERDDAVSPSYDEYIGKENTFSLVFKSSHAELYAHDGFTPGGWLIAGGSVEGGAYNACSGAELPVGAQLVQCDEIVDYYANALNVGALVSTVSGAGSKTFRVGANISAAANNRVSIAADGLYVPPVLDCDGQPLASTAHLPTCDMIVTSAELDYKTTTGTLPAPGMAEATGLETTNGPHFEWAVIRFFNSDDVELFFVDVTDMLNSIETPIVAGDNSIVIGDDSIGNQSVAVAISAEADNALTLNTDGLYIATAASGDTVSAGDASIEAARTGSDVAISVVVDPAADNTLEITGNGLYVPPTAVTMPVNTPLIVEAAADITLTAAQIAATGYSGLLVLANSESDITITVPDNIERGRSFAIMQQNIGKVYITGDGTYGSMYSAPEGMTGSPRGPFSTITCLCLVQGSGSAVAEWVLMGDLGFSEG